MQQIFTNHLLSGRNSSRCWSYRDELDKLSELLEMTFHLLETQALSRLFQMRLLCPQNAHLCELH